MPTATHLRNLKRALGTYRRALEEFESALLEIGETPDENEEAPKRSPNAENLWLLSLPEVCMRLGEERAVVHWRLRSGEIPALKLGHALKVRHADLQEYVKGQRRNHASGAPGEKNGSLGT